MSDDIEMGATTEVGEFFELVSYGPETPWEDNLAFKLYVQACAKKYTPEGQSFEKWSETATVEDFVGQVYAMETLPVELQKTDEMTDEARSNLWHNTARKKFENECERDVLPLVAEAVEEDAQKWHMQKPSTSDLTSSEYKEFMKEAAKRKAFELYGYLYEIEEAGFEYRSEDASSRIEQVGEELEALMNTEESFDITWYKRPLHMNDEEWVREKKRTIEEARKKDEEEQENKTDEEKEREKLQRDEDERETARAHALRNQNDDIIEVRTKPNSAVHKIYADMVMILSYWWDHGPQKDDLSKLATLNQHVRLAVSDADYIPIAPSELQFWIERVRQQVKESTQANNQQKDRMILQLAKDVITLSNILRKYGFDWKIIANRRIQREILILLYVSEDAEIRKRRDVFVKSILEPYDEQKEFLEKFETILGIVKNALDHKSMETLRIAIASLTEINNSVVPRINTGLGLKRDDHCFPIIHLQTIADQGDSESEIRKLVAKLTMLGINTTVMVEEFELGLLELRQMEKEVLGLVVNLKETPEVQASYPQLTFGGAELLYDWCAEKKTVAWGKHNRVFFINQYGPDTAPIFRKESRPVPGYQDNRYEEGLPPKQNISSGDNRIGSIKEPGSNTKKLYRSRAHIHTIYGVAFAEDPIRFPRDKFAYLTELTKGNHRDSAYVLVGWDRYLNKFDIEKRWEPASELRARMPHIDADKWIMEQAVKNQKRFEKHYACATEPTSDTMQEAMLLPMSPSSEVTRRRRAGMNRDGSVEGTGNGIPSPAGMQVESVRVENSRGGGDAEELKKENQELKKLLEDMLQRLSLRTGS